LGLVVAAAERFTAHETESRADKNRRARRLSQHLLHHGATLLVAWHHNEIHSLVQKLLAGEEWKKAALGYRDEWPHNCGDEAWSSHRLPGSKCYDLIWRLTLTRRRQSKADKWEVAAARAASHACRFGTDSAPAQRAHTRARSRPPSPSLRVRPALSRAANRSAQRTHHRGNSAATLLASQVTSLTTTLEGFSGEPEAACREGLAPTSWLTRASWLSRFARRPV